jgi:nitrite reductase/ring-hydroxylating ferredoxin subunit
MTPTKQWFKIFESREQAHLHLKEGAPQLLILRGQSVCLVMKNDSLYAVENKCAHNGESLSKGKVNFLSEIVCPWHGYRFNLKTGRECAERCRDLQVYSVLENDEGVFVGL